MKNTYLLLLLTLFVGIGAQAQTNVPSVISSNQTWSASGSPYIISQNTLIDAGVKVTVDPGVVVRASAKNLTLFVDGEFQAIGTQTSPIRFDSLEIAFNSGSVGYDPSTGNGAHFNWCNFTGEDGVYKAAIKSIKIDLKVENSNFDNCYWGINSSGNSADSMILIVDNCTFGPRSTSNYPIRFFGSTSEAHVTNCRFDYPGYLYFYGRVYFENNVVQNFSQFACYTYHEAVIKCNTFKNAGAGLNFTFYSVSDIVNFEFAYNTLDSIGSSSQPMLKIQRQTGNDSLNNLRIHHNNFLHNNAGVPKVSIVGTNASMTTSESLDFEDNYWGSTDSATISGWISDYNDDITIFGSVDFDPVLTSENVGCGFVSTCDASYYLALDTSTIYNLYVVNNSTGTTGNTTYSWSFGDGSTSSSQNPTHQYSSFGLYELCLTISDSAAGCQSTFCDSIGLDSLGRLLKADGFSITVVDEGDLSSVQPMKVVNGANVYPNPTQGALKLSVDLASTEELHVNILNAMGQLVSSNEYEMNAGSNDVTLDLSGNANGLYFVNLQIENETRTFRVMLNQ